MYFALVGVVLSFMGCSKNQTTAVMPTVTPHPATNDLLGEKPLVTEEQAAEEYCNSGCATEYGTDLGTFNGVTAYSNCQDQCVNPVPNFVEFEFGSGEVSQVFSGVKWQCVEYARRYWLTTYNVAFGSVDIAADIWSETVANRVDGSQIELKPFVNGAATAPQVGDLLVYPVSDALPCPCPFRILFLFPLLCPSSLRFSLRIELLVCVFPRCP